MSQRPEGEVAARPKERGAYACSKDYVCVTERGVSEREEVGACVRVHERKRERGHMRVQKTMRASEREECPKGRKRVCVCVCMRERERGAYACSKDSVCVSEG